MSNRRSLSVFVSAPLGVVRLSFSGLPGNRGLCRTGYLLRGRCRLNLINSMRHLDKCAPRTRIQRIIFILIHLPFPSFSPPLPHRPLLHLLFFLNCPILWSLEPFLRLSDPRFILVKRKRARREEERARERGGREAECREGKKRTRLSAPISPGSFVFLMSRRI